jgi:hypothetical protein
MQMQSIVVGLVNISAARLDITPIVHGLETLIWDLRDDAKESAREAAVAKVAADEGKAAAVKAAADKERAAGIAKAAADLAKTAQPSDKAEPAPGYHDWCTGGR